MKSENCITVKYVFKQNISYECSVSLMHNV